MNWIFAGFKDHKTTSEFTVLYSGPNHDAGMKAIAASAGKFAWFGKLPVQHWIKVAAPAAPVEATTKKPLKK